MESKNKKPYKSKYVDIFRYMMNPDYKPPLEDQLTCDCGKVYKQKQSLIKHKAKCKPNKIASYEDAMNRVTELINEELANEPNEYIAEANLYMRFIDDLQKYSCANDSKEFDRLVRLFVDSVFTAYQNSSDEENANKQTPVGEFTYNFDLNGPTFQIGNYYAHTDTDTDVKNIHLVHHWPNEDENLSKAQQFLQCAITTENTTDVSGEIIHIEHRWVDEEDFPKIRSGQHSIIKDFNGDSRHVFYWSRPVAKKNPLELHKRDN